jgi:hypothetical protein
MYDTYNGTPLVLKCTQCGCKSWATQWKGISQNNDQN